jgi:hypothetical protein
LNGDVRPLDAIRVHAPITCNFSVALCNAVTTDLKRNPLFRAFIDNLPLSICGLKPKRDFLLTLPGKNSDVLLLTFLKELVNGIDNLVKSGWVDSGDYPLLSQYFDYNGNARINDFVDFIEGLLSKTLIAEQDMFASDNENKEFYHLVKPRTPSQTINPMPGPLIMGTMETFETSIFRYGRRVSFSFGMATEETCVYRDTCLMDVDSMCTSHVSCEFVEVSVFLEPPQVYEPMDLSDGFDLPSDIEEQIENEESSDDFWDTDFHNLIILGFYPSYDGATVSFDKDQWVYAIGDASVVCNVTECWGLFPTKMTKSWDKKFFVAVTFDSHESKMLHIKRWNYKHDVLQSMKDVAFHNAVVRQFIPSAWQYTAYNWHACGAMCIGNIVIVEVTHFTQKLKIAGVKLGEKITWDGKIFTKIAFKNVTLASNFMNYADVFYKQLAPKQKDVFYDKYLSQLVADAFLNINLTRHLDNAKTWMNLAVVSNEMHAKIDVNLNASEPRSKKLKAN